MSTVEVLEETAIRLANIASQDVFDGRVVNVVAFITFNVGSREEGDNNIVVWKYW